MATTNSYPQVESQTRDRERLITISSRSRHDLVTTCTFREQSGRLGLDSDRRPLTVASESFVCNSLGRIPATVPPNPGCGYICSMQLVEPLAQMHWPRQVSRPSSWTQMLVSP
jgi:hypothetical protein